MQQTQPGVLLLPAAFCVTVNLMWSLDVSSAGHACHQKVSLRLLSHQLGHSKRRLQQWLHSIPSSSHASTRRRDQEVCNPIYHVCAGKAGVDCKGQLPNRATTTTNLLLVFV